MSAEIIERLYTAFDAKDAAGMAPATTPMLPSPIRLLAR